MNKVTAYVIKDKNYVYGFKVKSKIMLPSRLDEGVSNLIFDDYIMKNNIITGPKTIYGPLTVVVGGHDYIVTYNIIDIKLDIKDFNPKYEAVKLPLIYADKTKFDDLYSPVIDKIRYNMNISKEAYKALCDIYFNYGEDLYGFIKETLIKIKNFEVAHNIKNVDDFKKYIFKENRRIKHLRKNIKLVNEVIDELWKEIIG